jgi:hypothetical protein
MELDWKLGPNAYNSPQIRLLHRISATEEMKISERVALLTETISGLFYWGLGAFGR